MVGENGHMLEGLGSGLRYMAEPCFIDLAPPRPDTHLFLPPPFQDISISPPCLYMMHFLHLQAALPQDEASVGKHTASH